MHFFLDTDFRECIFPYVLLVCYIVVLQSRAVMGGCLTIGACADPFRGIVEATGPVDQKCAAKQPVPPHHHHHH